MKRCMLACWLGVVLGGLAFEPIFLKATDFVVASGNPSLQIWDGSVPVWSFSGTQLSQSITAVTPPLPLTCGAVRVELLLVNSEQSTNELSAVYRVDLKLVATGETLGKIKYDGKPVRVVVPKMAKQIRREVLEGCRIVQGGSPLVVRLAREPNDSADTFIRPEGLVGVWITPLEKLPQASVVENRPGYNSWPMMQSVGNTLICTYSRGSGHTIHEGKRNAFARTSKDGGKTWTPEVCFAQDPNAGEVMIGKGADLNGDALFWVRCIGGKSRHELYRTKDGITFTKIAVPTLDPFPMQITDIFKVPQGLMALWFATDYKDESNHSWGTLLSVDNGITWKQTTIETVKYKNELPTEPCVVHLGEGKLLGLARTECGGGALASQFQLTSIDSGVTWQKTRTNIRDILASSPSLIYNAETGKLYNYYYERGEHVVKCRVTDAQTIFDNPFSWPAPVGILQGDEERPWDAGNVNAVQMGKTHYLTYYSGTAHDTTVYVAPAF